MKKKRGRPKIENPRNLYLRVRLNTEEMSNLIYISDRYGKSKAEIIRKLITEKFAKIMKN